MQHAGCIAGHVHASSSAALSSSRLYNQAKYNCVRWMPGWWRAWTAWYRQHMLHRLPSGTVPAVHRQVQARASHLLPNDDGVLMSQAGESAVASYWWTISNRQHVPYQVAYPVAFQDFAHFSSLMLCIHGPERVNGTSSCQHDPSTATRMLINLQNQVVQ